MSWGHSERQLKNRIIWTSFCLSPKSSIRRIFLQLHRRVRVKPGMENLVCSLHVEGAAHAQVRWEHLEHGRAGHLDPHPLAHLDESRVTVFQAGHVLDVETWQEGAPHN